MLSATEVPGLTNCGHSLALAIGDWPLDLYNSEANKVIGNHTGYFRERGVKPENSFHSMEQITLGLQKQKVVRSRDTGVHRRKLCRPGALSCRGKISN